MSVDLVTALRFNTHISLQFKPEQNDGLILYMSQPQPTGGDFPSLLLVNGSLIFTLQALRSGQPPLEGKWSLLPAAKPSRSSTCTFHLLLFL